jgi:Fe-S cluster biosynthesis and repair protein YggX
MADLKLEFCDIKNLLPVITDSVRRELLKEIEKEDFFSYPDGLQQFLFHEVSDKTYQRVRRLWNKPDFPRILEPKGVYLKDLKKWQILQTALNR